MRSSHVDVIGDVDIFNLSYFIYIISGGGGDGEWWDLGTHQKTDSNSNYMS